MRRSLYSGMAIVLCLALVATAQAKGPGGASRGSSRGSPGTRTASSRTINHENLINHGGNTNRSVSQPARSGHFQTHGTKFSHGYFFKGKNHDHWKYRSWSRRFHCHCYWDADLACWYYWCAAESCYYPMSYADECTPTSEDDEDD